MSSLNELRNSLAEQEVLVLSLGAAAVIVTGGLYLWPLAQSGVWISRESPFYLAIAYAVEENLRNGQGIWGWSAHDLGGFPVFSLFMPSALGILGVTIIHQVMLVSLPVAYKVMVGLAVLLPALSLWFVLVRRACVMVAFVSANLSLLLTYNLVEPLNGKWGTYLAIGLLLPLMSVGESWLGTGPSWGRALAIVALALAIAMSDPSAWVALSCAVVALAIAYGVRGSTPSRMTVWFALTLSPLVMWIFLLISGDGGAWGLDPEVGLPSKSIFLGLPVWFLLPGSGQLLVQDLTPAIRGMEWTTAVFLTGWLLLEHLPELSLFALVLAGARKILWQRAEIINPLHRWGIAHLIMAVLLLSVSVLPRQLVGRWVAEPQHLVPYVNLAFLGIGSLALQTLRWRFAGAPPWHIGVLLALSLTVAHGIRYATYEDQVLLKTADESVVHQELSDVWWYLRSHLAGTPTQVLYETLEGLGFLDGGSSALTALSTQETGLPSLASWRLSTLAWVRRPPLLSEGNPLRPLSRVPEIMRRWNCGYLVVWWPGTREKLRALGVFEVVHESPNRLFTVLRLREYEPSWLEFEQPVRRTAPEAQLMREGLLRFSVENSWEGNRAILKIAYHPRWRAWVNGTSLALTDTGGQIVTEPLPTGSLELTFAFLGPWSILPQEEPRARIASHVN